MAHIPTTMQAMDIKGGKLVATTLPVPTVRDGEVLIKVAYAGVNRADLLQLKGLYPVPKNAPSVPGLEVVGKIVALGKNVHNATLGAEVCALLSGGGYAQYCTANAALLFALPKAVAAKSAAALPEALFTVAMALLWKAKLKAGEKALIHSGASGVGTIAIQAAKALGATVYSTSGTREKCAICKKLGATRAINYRKEDFADILNREGVDVVLDTTGGDHLSKNIQILRQGGRVVLISFLRGSGAGITLSELLFKHITLMGTTLRNQPLKNKKIIKKHVDKLIPLVEARAIKPVIDSTYSLKDAQKALKYMEQNLNIGKIVLKV